MQANQKKIRREENNEEVIIVGGSAAGFYTAAKVRLGRQACARVGIQTGLGAGVSRTLIVTDHVRRQLGSSANESVLNEIRRFELFTDGRSAQVALAKPDLVIERAKIDSGAGA